MKCPNCGNEFGNGVNCQSCGMDKVTAFAKYDGYSSPKSLSGRQQNMPFPFTNEQSIVTVREMNDVCPFCGEIIPGSAAYCPYCGQSLTVTCPICNHEYPAKYPCCPKCGTNRVQYLRAKQEQEVQRRKEELKRQQEEEKQKNERERREWEERQKKLELQIKENERLRKQEALEREVYSLYNQYSEKYDKEHRGEGYSCWSFPGCLITFSPALLVLPAPLFFKNDLDGVWLSLFVISITACIISLIYVNSIDGSFDSKKAEIIEKEMADVFKKNPEYRAIWNSNKKYWCKRIC